MADIYISASEIQKRYRSTFQLKNSALQGVSLSVESGTIIGIIGQNGAGKTTLVKILLGLCTPTSGSARILERCPGDPIVNRQIGYLPEQMHIPGHFGSKDFLRYMGLLAGIDSNTLDERIPRVLEDVGLGGEVKLIKHFSKGMKQRIGLAQSLINDPKILFLDEPTDGLDPLGRILIRDLLVRLRQIGKTIVLNSHLLSEIELICDRIVILHKGKVVRTATPSEFTHGTGEYMMQTRIPRSLSDFEVKSVVDRVVGRADWLGDTVRFRPRDSANLNELVDALRDIRVELLSIEPMRLSLEEFFIQVVGERKL